MRSITKTITSERSATTHGIAVVGKAVPLDTTLGLGEDTAGEGLSRRTEGLELSGDCTQVH